MPVAENLAGQKFGRLTAIEDIGKTTRGRVWRCMCECGQETESVSTYLKNGHKKSCGCLHADSAKISGMKQRTHGYTTVDKKWTASEYGVWMSMKARCGNPKTPSYKRYGARGIEVCERWIKFENFIQDMGKRPTNKHSLDRIDTHKGYEPGNCRWADQMEQAQTRTNVRKIHAFGETMTAAMWGRKTGITAMTIRNRIDAGWTPEDAVTKPKKAQNASATA
jgi:hypothetical protein